jgi:hypothetical protein
MSNNTESASKYDLGEHPGMRWSGRALALAGLYMVLAVFIDPANATVTNPLMDTLFYIEVLALGPFALIVVNVGSWAYVINFAQWWPHRKPFAQRPWTREYLLSTLSAAGAFIMFATNAAVYIAAMTTSEPGTFPFSVLLYYPMQPFPAIYSVGTVLFVVSRMLVNRMRKA